MGLSNGCVWSRTLSVSKGCPVSVTATPPAVAEVRGNVPDRATQARDPHTGAATSPGRSGQPGSARKELAQFQGHGGIRTRKCSRPSGRAACQDRRPLTPPRDQAGLAMRCPQSCQRKTGPLRCIAGMQRGPHRMSPRTHPAPPCASHPPVRTFWAARARGLARRRANQVSSGWPHCSPSGFRARRRRSTLVRKRRKQLGAMPPSA